MPKYAKELYGPLGKYLGHFRNKKILAAGHNVTKPLAETLEKTPVVSEADKKAAREAAEQQERVMEELGYPKPKGK